VVEGDPGDPGGAQRLVFAVSLDRPFGQDVTFLASTLPGTADGSDFAALSGVPGIIRAGETSATVAVDVLPDETVETNETMTLLLSQVVGATAGRVQATGTIREDDQPVRLSVSDARTVEGDDVEEGRQLVFTVSLSAPLDRAVSFDFGVDAGAGTASYGDDYFGFEGGFGSGFLEAGETRLDLAFTLFGDVAVETDETVVLRLANVTGVLTGRAAGTGTIANDDFFVDTAAADIVVGRGDLDETLVLLADGRDDFFDANEPGEAVDSDTLDLGGLDIPDGAEAFGASVSLGVEGFVSTTVSGFDSLAGFENVIGTDLPDSIDGSFEANRIEGRGGADFIDGQDGDDTIDGGAGADSISGGFGGDDVLSGGTVHDSIYGGYFGDDQLFGDGGDDYLDGEDGADLLTGGAGTDRFAIGGSSLSNGVDTIADFQQGADRLVPGFSQSGTPDTIAFLGQAGALLDSGAALGGEADAYYLFVGGRTQLVIDDGFAPGEVDGADTMVLLDGLVALAPGDFEDGFGGGTA
jgi:Ca2+-binding RTX toxin-like protein